MEHSLVHKKLQIHVIEMDDNKCQCVVFMIEKIEHFET